MDNESFKLLAEFQRLKTETDEINGKIRAGNPFLTTNTSNGVLGAVLTELKMLRMEVKEMKETQTKLQEDVSVQKEMLKDLKAIKENQTILQLNVSQLKCLPNIREHFFGKWRCVEKPNVYFSAKFEEDIFILKWSENGKFFKYKLGVKHPNGRTVAVEDNMIVTREHSNGGVEAWKRELYINNDKLVLMEVSNGEDQQKSTNERFGDPDSE